MRSPRRRRSHGAWPFLVLALVFALVPQLAHSAPPTRAADAANVDDAPQLPDGAKQASAALEAAGFVAVEAQDWCQAMHYFSQADQEAPAVALVANAAQAAELAGDLEAAAAFSRRIFKDAKASTLQKREAYRALGRLKAARKEQPGVACADFVPPPPPTPPPQENEPTSSPVVVAPPPPPNYGLPTLLGGASVAALGSVVTAVGAAPFFGHSAAVDAINAAERNRADARELQASQQENRAAWESWGQPTVVVGSAAIGLGVVVVAAGIFLMVDGAEEALPERERQTSTRNAR